MNSGLSITVEEDSAASFSALTKPRRATYDRISDATLALRRIVNDDPRGGMGECQKNRNNERNKANCSFEDR